MRGNRLLRRIVHRGDVEIRTGRAVIHAETDGRFVMGFWNVSERRQSFRIECDAAFRVRNMKCNVVDHAFSLVRFRPVPSDLIESLRQRRMFRSIGTRPMERNTWGFTWPTAWWWGRPRTGVCDGYAPMPDQGR